MATVVKVYEQLRQVDPFAQTFPEIRRKLIEIQAAQAGTYQRCSTLADYAGQLKELSKTYNESPTDFSYKNVAELFRCMMRYSARTNSEYTIPSLTAGVSRLITDLQQAPDFDDYKFYNLLYNGLDIAYIKTTGNTTITKLDAEIINESWIGLVYLNSLKEERDPSPYFKYIYGAFTCGKLDDHLPNMAEACCNGAGVIYAIQERLEGDDLHAWLTTPGRRPFEIVSVYIQLIKALVQAASHGVNNFNFRSIDIVVETGMVPVILSARQKFTAMAYPVIVDFTDCVATTITNRYIPTILNGNDIAGLRRMFLSALSREPALAQFVNNYPTPTFNSMDIPTDLLAELGGQIVVESASAYQLGVGQPS